MYRNKEYRVRALDELLQEIRDVAPRAAGVRRVFLADGDALAAPFEVLEAVLGEIRKSLPSAHRIGIYGDSRSILKRGVEELRALAGLGLGIVYFGAETGDEETLKQIRKGATVERQIEACHIVKEAGLKSSVMVLLGLAGVAGSERHAAATGTFLAKASPTYSAALTVTPVKGTELYQAMIDGEFELPDRWGMLFELRTMLHEMGDYRGIFHANHASNYLPLKLRLPRDRQSAIDLLDRTIKERNEDILQPEYMRGL